MWCDKISLWEGSFGGKEVMTFHLLIKKKKKYLLEINFQIKAEERGKKGIKKSAKRGSKLNSYFGEVIRIVNPQWKPTPHQDNFLGM